MVGDLHIRIAKLAFHAKESPIRTRDEVFNLVSSQSDSPAKGYSPAVRRPPNPGLPQSSSHKLCSSVLIEPDTSSLMSEQANQLHNPPVMFNERKITFYTFMHLCDKHAVFFLCVGVIGI